uniref:MARVEL domain-containing protein n=1 Tax=Moschus moschiferus TaxID=68415 RepID=A0A8C6DLR4_MOSMO
MGIWRGVIGDWSMSIWGICFAVTLIISIVELCDLPSCFPFYWYTFPVTYACYAALICLSASIIYSIAYVQFLPYGPYRDRAIAATAFSCSASVFYALDVAFTWNWYDLDDTICYVHTVPGLLKVLETLVAGVIFAFLSSPSLYLHPVEHHTALVWCVAVYCICFILGAVVLLLKLREREYRLCILYPIFQLVLTLFSTLLYISTVVLWPLYQFNEEFGGQSRRASVVSCSDELAYDMCLWDRLLAVAILTAINLLMYMVDLVYWARQGSIGTEDVSSAPDAVLSHLLFSQSEDAL